MKLSKEEIEARLLEARTSQDFHNLYEIVFGEKVPETEIRDPNEELEMIINAIDTNEKIKGIELPKNYLI